MKTKDLLTKFSFHVKIQNLNNKESQFIALTIYRWKDKTFGDSTKASSIYWEHFSSILRVPGQFYIAGTRAILYWEYQGNSILRVLEGNSILRVPGQFYIAGTGAILYYGHQGRRNLNSNWDSRSFWCWELTPKRQLTTCLELAPNTCTIPSKWV